MDSPLMHWRVGPETGGGERGTRALDNLVGDNIANAPLYNILPDCLAFLCIKMAITLAANRHCSLYFESVYRGV